MPNLIDNYQTDVVTTVAGAINTANKITGMIIQPVDESLATNDFIQQSSQDLIYYTQFSDYNIEIECEGDTYLDTSFNSNNNYTLSKGHYYRPQISYKYTEVDTSN